VRRTADDLEQRLGRRPSGEEVRKATRLSLEEVVEAQVAGRALSAVSLESRRNDDEGGAELHETLGAPDPDLQRLPERTTIASAIETLSPRDRTILRLRYQEDLTQAAIGERLGVSQMTVSRALRRALPRLQALHAAWDQA
jgi:RNA polymerase sigma-B factor